MSKGLGLCIALLLAISGCGDIGYSVTEAVPDQSPGRSESDGEADLCHRNLLDLQYAEYIYFCTIAHEYTTDLQALYLILGVKSLKCPSCGGEYLVQVDEDWFRIDCPLEHYPNHGYVTPLSFSWPPDPAEYEAICHDNMSNLMTALVLYYSRFANEYPQDLSELDESGIYGGADDLACPACSTVYIYEVGPDAQTYFLSCPLPIRPNHGEVDTGVPSW